MSDDTTLACIRVVELMTAYLEGELDPDTMRKFDEHLAVCPPCQVYLEQIRQTIDEIGAVPVETLSEDTRADLLQAFRAIHNTDTPQPNQEN
ncbi:MAG: anti-sigma factor family protein [Acidothermaceae bacterium]